MVATIPPTVLLIRPKAASVRFATQIDAPCVVSPLMETVWLTPKAHPEPDALVFTSESGVLGWAQLHGRRGPAYCVGDRTAAVARAQGFDAQSAGGDALDLAQMLDALPKSDTLVHARGVHVASDLGARVVPYIVYDQRPCDFTPEAVSLLQSRCTVVVMPFFSPRSVALFKAQNSPLRAKLLPVAMSPTVADAVHAAGLGTAKVAMRPDGDSMLRVIRSLLS